jgi:hypothetical protein
MAKVAKNTEAGAMANFAIQQPRRGRAKNLGSLVRCFTRTEILQVRLRAQNDTVPFGSE